MFSRLLCRVGLHQLVATIVSTESTRTRTGRKVMRYSMCTVDDCRFRIVEERLGPDEPWEKVDFL